jgi:hypothetical protein
MSGLAVKALTALGLGLPNLWRAVTYRVGVRLGLNPVRRIQANIPEGVFFSANIPNNPVQLAAPQQWFDGHSYFGWYRTSDTSIPNWHENPFTGRAVKQPKRPWWLISDFDEEIGDIKTIWEASRFDWVLTFAQHALNGKIEAMSRLNMWLTDWVQFNRPYQGPNWKCGQEASIRVMHLAMAAVLLGQHRQTAMPLQALIKAHLQRIAPTIQYAIAQNNNHGTSEAAALFIGGSWLHSLGDDDGENWYHLGRKWLENRATLLIEEDGSFSQYSMNYHRVMLDTYSMVEYWRRSLALPAFSQKLYRQLDAAALWLYQMTQSETGDAPNLGANDGARLLPLSDCDFRDFRPSVQLAMALFCDCCAYSGDGSWNLPLQWMGVPVPVGAVAPPVSTHFAQGGYSVLRRGKCFVLLRFPQFRFRPSQADALHVDLWVAGKNLLHDSGSYSYHAGDEITQYFGGTAGHNTVQFDDRDQMPRLSRFLFGDWLKAKSVTPITKVGSAVSAAAGYIDGQGASHHRTVSLEGQRLRVEDSISGFRHKAVLRWRLAPGQWTLSGNICDSKLAQVCVSLTAPMRRLELTTGWESLYYHQKKELPVLEIEVGPGNWTIETIISLKD